MAATYTPIATQTLGSAAAGITFSSIPSSYTDIIAIANGSPASSGRTLVFQVNGDTATNYSFTALSGNGSAASSNRASSVAYGLCGFNNVGADSTVPAQWITQFQNYSNTTTYKTAISRGAGATKETDASVSLWRSTSAINSIYFFFGGPTNMNAGFSITLYGIQAA